MAGTYGGPPLPPRASKPNSSQSGNHSPYSKLLPSSGDPRRSSTQSLPPAESHERRTLLLIYIHGFMGAETSFRSFPAHVHNLVAITLADSHVVHTKIYPRYQARRTIDQVAEDFSRWLSPHESDHTDVVLLSHSMGGLIAAEVELLPAVAISPGHTFRHRIIGNINFDVPFLGMHPGVVSAGLGSIFNPAPPPTEVTYESDGGPLSAASSLTVDSQSTLGSTGPTRYDTLFSPPADPNFNPKFHNDVVLPVRKGWQNAMHFMSKHSDNLRKATKQLVKSHVEFGGAMADYSGLRIRYMKIRALEDEDTTIRRRLAHQAEIPARVRFINYYTASPGRKKKERSRSKSPYGQFLDSTTSLGPSTHHSNLSSHSVSSQSMVNISPRISVDEHIGDKVVHKGEVEPAPSPSSLPPLQEESAPTVTSDHREPVHTNPKPATPHIHVQMPNLPPLPPPPMEPMALDLTPYPDEEARKLIRREHERQVRAYKQAMDDREAALRDRQDLEDRLRNIALGNVPEEKKPVKEGGFSATAPVDRAAVIEQSTEGEEPQRRSENAPNTGSNTETHFEGVGSPPQIASPGAESQYGGPNYASSFITMDREETRSTLPGEEPKKKKDRKFCVLPKKINEERDPLWVRVFMDGHDAVSAHTGLFFMGPTYERLVGDVGDKIEEWVRDDMTRRMIDDYAA